MTPREGKSTGLANDYRRQGYEIVTIVGQAFFIYRNSAAEEKAVTKKYNTRAADFLFRDFYDTKLARLPEDLRDPSFFYG